MSRENVEKVQEGFEAYVRGDLDGTVAYVDPDVEFKLAQEAPGRGIEELRAALQRWGSDWDELETTAEEVIDAGDHVLLALHFRGRGRGSGVEVEDRFYEVFTFRDGKIVRWWEYSDRDEALNAAGLGD